MSLHNILISHKFLVMNCSVLLLFLILSFLVSVSSGSQKRMILRAIIKEVNNKDGDFAVDLNATNFDSVLNDTPTPYAIVEFFAHWLVHFPQKLHPFDLGFQE